MIQLRDYQLKAHEDIIDCFKKELKTLLVMATGAGKSKTVISFVEKLKKYCIFIIVVQNRKLVNQLAEDTKLFNLDYGVFMADHDELDLSKPIQVCSIDTINTRGTHPHISHHKDIVLIIDEADQAKSYKFQSMINRYMNRDSVGRTFLLGMTATPYNELDFFDTFINPITPKELLKRGYLVDYKYYIPKESIDYSNIIVSKGEWSAKQVSAKLNTPSMIANCFKAWQQFGENRQTLIFCMDKQHCINFCHYINNYYGSTQAKFIYDKTSDDERKSIFKEFSEGRIKFLVNIRIITRGVDLPVIGTILDCAATLNLNTHIQKLGRGSRKNDFYKDCIVIDPAKNVLNNGHFYQERKIDLKSAYKRNKKDALETQQMRQCLNCFRAFEPQGNSVSCPYCGGLIKQEYKKPLTRAAKNKIFMESASPEAIEQRQMINEYKKLLWQFENMRKMGKVRARKEACFKLVKKHGVEKCLKVRKSINLDETTLKEYKRRHEYTPLGGML